MDIKRYEFDKTIILYLIDEKRHTSMLLIPRGAESRMKKAWDIPNSKFDAKSPYMHDWRIGSIAHLKLSHHPVSNRTMKFGKSTEDLKFASQEAVKDGNSVKIITLLRSEEGYAIKHTVTSHKGYNAFTVNTEFINESDRIFTLEMLSSFSLDNLSPMHDDDAPNMYSLHRFRGGWSMEGKHICDDIEELSLEKAWIGAFPETEKFGSLGAYPTERFFPIASFEDKEYNIYWTAQLAHNATWQMELSRYGDTMSLSGGGADCEFGRWHKDVAPNESFSAPEAYISAVCGDIFEACRSITALGEIKRREYGEKGLPVGFNEWCTSWGDPTQDKLLAYADILKDKGVKYVVIDAGWSKDGRNQSGNGEWFVNTDRFPDMKGMCGKIREMGMIPGIWMEFEVTTEGSPVFDSKYDDLHLKRNGIVINNGGGRTFWDFRRKEVIDYLTERVIGMLKENGFGYLKVDYNANLGTGCDGAESPGEGLRQHEEQVREFFKKIKKEIPDIVIENCASGGHRLEPSMMAASGVSSFSDAHEAIEIPYIAANLHNLMLPAQSLVWAVIHEDDKPQRIAYSIAAAFLGRICLSGDIDKLSYEQWDILKAAFEFYNSCEDIIVNGITRIYGNRGRNTRYPTGTQVVIRKTDNEMMIVIHKYKNSGEEMTVNIDRGFKVSEEFFADNMAEIKDGKLIIKKASDFSACALKLVKEI